MRNDLDKKNAVTVIDAVRGPLRGAAPSSACAGSGITRCKLKIKRRLQCEKTNDEEKEKIGNAVTLHGSGPRPSLTLPSAARIGGGHACNTRL